MTHFPYVVEYTDYTKRYAGTFNKEQLYPVHEWLETNYPDLSCAHHDAGGWYEKYRKVSGTDFTITFVLSPLGDTRDTCLVSFKDEQVAMHFKLKFG